MNECFLFLLISPISALKNNTLNSKRSRIHSFRNRNILELSLVFVLIASNFAKLPWIEDSEPVRNYRLLAFNGRAMGSIQKPATCGICFEDKLPVTENIYHKRAKCSKFHPFCQDCMATHILYRIQSRVATVRCPGVECTAKLDPIECQTLIPGNVFVEWCDILVDAWIARKGHKRAVCPYEGCAEVVIDECKSGGKQECAKCRREFCFGCGVKWERNHHEVCRYEELVFLNAARQGSWKRCPNCRFFVQRSTGCNSVSCRCGTTFCYKCGVETCRCQIASLQLDENDGSC
ncbi:hypothetical protein RND81_05G190300 [Saponaria officinalis]|uniref:RBR-type E3 ubiquitin transferase n=1 Tax=Saponaria officinalis TaxID=3572 RepID=A0AAW1L002_SAPOF